MKYLIINSGRVYFLNSKGETNTIDSISKEDILFLLDEATKEDIIFQMDEPIDGNIQNAAHKIIYDALYGKFSELLKNKHRFIDETNRLYEEAFQKYQDE